VTDSTATRDTLRVRPLTPELVDTWAALFEACASGCFCRYWHFEGNKNDWLARLAFSPETNAREQRACVGAADPSARGLVALDAGVAIGWLKLAPRGAVPKLRRLPVYRALDLGADEGVLAIGCLLVHPSHRRRGVARALVEGAIAGAAETGAEVLEAYPHRRSEALRDEELWMGPASLFEELGFTVIDGNPAYPVLRRSVAARRNP
jgi:GNAT superfamily N-acetyltransferase